jgi:hypothetical protein
VVYTDSASFFLQSPFFEFVSNPPSHGECCGSRSRPRLSVDEVDAIVAAHRQGLLEEDKETHILI